MAAYAALVSLSNTIERLLNHNRLSISLEKKQQLLSLLEHANSFQDFLENFPDKFNSLEGRMRELAHEAEDIIEYFMLDIEGSFFQTKVMKLLLEKKIKNIHSTADSPAALASSSTAPPIYNDIVMVGFEDLVIELKDRLCGKPSKLKEYEGNQGADSPIRKDSTGGWFQRFIHPLRREPSKLQVIPIYGVCGIGKTTLARYLYHDPLIMEHFEIRVWVNHVSQDYSPHMIISSILESLEEHTKDVKGQSYDEKVLEVYKILRARRYLVVIDDIWSMNAWNAVREVFPDNHNGSRVMVITISSRVTSKLDPSRKLHKMVLLNEDESWDFLKGKVFGDEECPSELENFGKDIARRCKGWPLTLAMIVGILSTTTRNSWEAWAEEYRDESRCYQHQLQLEKVIEEIGLIAGEVREINDSSSSSNDVQGGGASSHSIITNRNTTQLGAAASSSSLIDKTRFLPAKFSKFKSKHHMKNKAFDSTAGKVMSMVQLGDSSSSSNNVQRVLVGFEDYLIDLKDRLCGEPSKKLQVIPICGMGGIGKTTLARNVYVDPLITNHFDVRVWVTISQDFSTHRILPGLVESLKEFDNGGLGQSDDEKTLSDDEKVHKVLKGRRYLVVMDDIWSSEAWDIVRSLFPDDGNGSRVMLTTRLSDMASYPDPSSKIYELPLLNEDESWNLLKQNVFGDEDCPSELQDIGKKIARSCKGLPLAIVVIAGLLSTTMRSLVSWKVIAENVKSAKHDQIEKILALSYVHLPQYLRPCFLYMASFPEDYEIDVLKLIRLWIAEGFVKSPIDPDSFEKVAEEFLEELVKRNLVLVAKREWDGRIKSCSLHDLMREFCIRNSHESKFFLNTKDSLIEKLRNQRRVSVDFFNLKFMSRLHDLTIRSIECSKTHPAFAFGTLDFLKSVRLLRVLDAEPFRVCDLLTLVHLEELFHLRYLAITSLGSFHLSRLQNLQTLVILDEHRFSTSSLQLKWCMSQLRHVYYDGTIDFEDPKETDCPLESLQTLSYISLSTCRETILKMIPNLKQLQIDCSKYLPSDGGVCLDDLVHLHRLEDLGIRAGGQIKYYKVTFPRMLKKLILSWWELPWNAIFVIGSLPNLQVLELIGCTCVGGTWETTEGAFPVLEVLKISSSSFENWVTESSHFPRLKLLLLHDCKNLNEIPNDIGEISTLQLIEVIEVKKSRARKSLIDSVELIREEQEEMGNNTLQVVCSVRDYFRHHR